VSETIALGHELSLLVFARGHVLDLAQLERHQVELAVASTREALQLGGASLELADLVVHSPVVGAPRLLLRTAEAVEHVKLGGGQHQFSVLVLAVERQQPAPQLAQVGDGGRSPAHVGASAAVGPHAASEHELVGPVRDALVPLGPGREREHTFDVRLRRSFADDPAACLAAEQQVERVREQRLSGAGLTGEDVQSLGQPKLGSLHQQQVLHAQLVQHAPRGTTRPRRTLDRYVCPY
jgi:hypothetical protein